MEQLGIKPMLLLAQIINFGIIVFILTKFLYRPILKMLAKRRDEIAKGLALTEAMKQEEEKLNSRRTKLIDEARRQARTILEEARSSAKDEQKDILAQTHQQAEEILAKAKTDGERLKEELTKSVQKETVALAVAMAKRLLMGVVSEETQHAIIDKQLKELQSQAQTLSRT